MEQQNPKEFRAAVIAEDVSSPLPNRAIVPDQKLYMLSLDDEEEAHFVCGVLNSKHLRRILGGFLVGKQTSTTPFRYVRIPPYHASNPDHTAIARASKEAHAQRAGTRVTGDLDAAQQGQLDGLVLRLFA
jgi:hypothetical protein